MDVLDDKKITEALHAVVAKSILEGLDTEHRDALLQRSIAETIAKWDFRDAVSKVAAQKAADAAKEMMKSEDWTRRVEQAIRDGFDDYLKNLRAAIPEALTGMLHGKSGTYPSVGSILSCWPQNPKDDSEVQRLVGG